MRTRAFTLLELLIVMTAVTLLGGVLLSAVTTARNAAISTACMSNLRQVGMALIVCVDDHSGRYPAEGNKGDDDPDTSPAWFYQLPPYLEQERIGSGHDVFQCPAFDYVATGVFDNASPKSLKFNAWIDNAGRPQQYQQGHVCDERHIVGFFDALGGDTGVGQWGHGTPKHVDYQRHRGRVNVLHLDGSTLSSARGTAETDWESVFQWLSEQW